MTVQQDQIPFSDPRLRNWLTPEAIESFARDRWQRLQQSQGAKSFQGLHSEAVATPLVWDSEVTGRNCRQLHLRSTQQFPQDFSFFAEVEDWMERANCEYLMTRIESSNINTTIALQDNGFRQIESLLTYCQVPSRYETQVIELTSSDANEACSLAAASFVDGRYITDPVLVAAPVKCAYSEWTRNAINRKVGLGVLGIKQCGQLAGFVTLQSDTQLQRTTGMKLASIGLIVVDSAARGQGIGKQLVSAASDWAFQNNFDCLAVGTQASNIPAQRLYISCGFMPAWSELTLRKTKGIKP